MYTYKRPKGNFSYSVSRGTKKEVGSMKKHSKGLDLRRTCEVRQWKARSERCKVQLCRRTKKSDQGGEPILLGSWGLAWSNPAE